jgi:hypothetical protein|tara:strand:+ start:2809 stop:3129 length:321 start_codon:yes stop_codon:yes gene_type:complete
MNALPTACVPIDASATLGSVAAREKEEDREDDDSGAAAGAPAKLTPPLRRGLAPVVRDGRRVRSRGVTYGATIPTWFSNGALSTSASDVLIEICRRDMEERVGLLR